MEIGYHQFEIPLIAPAPGNSDIHDIILFSPPTVRTMREYIPKYSLPKRMHLINVGVWSFGRKGKYWAKSPG